MLESSAKEPARACGWPQVDSYYYSLNQKKLLEETTAEQKRWNVCEIFYRNEGKREDKVAGRERETREGERNTPIFRESLQYVFETHQEEEEDTSCFFVVKFFRFWGVPNDFARRTFLKGVHFLCSKGSKRKKVWDLSRRSFSCFQELFPAHVYFCSDCC